MRKCNLCLGDLYETSSQNQCSKCFFKLIDLDNLKNKELIELMDSLNFRTNELRNAKYQNVLKIDNGIETILRNKILKILNK